MLSCAETEKLIRNIRIIGGADPSPTDDEAMLLHCSTCSGCATLYDTRIKELQPQIGMLMGHSPGASIEEQIDDWWRRA